MLGFSKKRVSFRFSLRTLLTAILALCVILTLVSLRLQHSKTQQSLVKELRNKDAWIIYDYNADEGPMAWFGVEPSKGWIRDLLGEDFFPAGKTAIFFEATDTLKCLDLLRDLSGLHTIMFSSDPEAVLTSHELELLKNTLPGIKLKAYKLPKGWDPS